MNPFPHTLTSHIQLADERFNKSDTIDVLLGANIFFDTLCAEQMYLGKNKPILQRTRFGWILSGNMNVGIKRRKNTICNLAVINDNSLSEQVKKFWTLEEVTNERPSTIN